MVLNACFEAWNSPLEREIEEVGGYPRGSHGIERILGHMIKACLENCRKEQLNADKMLQFSASDMRLM